MKLNSSKIFAQRKRTKGATLVEYGALVGLIAVVAIGSVSGLGKEVSNVFGTVSTTLVSTTSAAGVKLTDAKFSSSSSSSSSSTPASKVPTSLNSVGTLAFADISPGSTSLTVDFPGTVKPGDTIVMPVFFRMASGGTLTVPTGWTEVGSEPGNSNIWMTAVLTKVYSVSDGTSVTLHQTDTSQFEAQMYDFAGANPAPSVVVSAKAFGASPSTIDPTFTLPSYTTLGPDYYTIAIAGERWANTGGNTTLTGPTGFTQTTPTSSWDNRLMLAYQKNAAAGTLVSGLKVTGMAYGNATNEWTTMMVQVGN